MQKTQKLWRKRMAAGLAFVMCISGASVMPMTADGVQAAEKITISSADELAKIGVDAAYPMDGD